MRGVFSLRRLTAALLLAMTALLASTGIASAHQGHSSAAPSHRHAAAEGAAKATPDRQSVEHVVQDSVLPAVLIVDVRGGARPCSDEGGAGHVGGCCTVACHAALAAPALLVEPCRAPSSLADGRPEQVLAGLSGDGNERPPKLG